MKKSAIAVLGAILMLASVSWASVCTDIQYLDTYKLNASVDGMRLAAGANGVVYIADSEGDYLKVLDRKGGLLGSKKIVDIVGVGVDADGLVYVGTAKEQRGGYSGAVKVYDAALSHVRSLGKGAGEFRFPAAIAADATRVYVADTAANVVKVYRRADGAYLAVMGGSGTSDSSTPWPTDVAIHPSTGVLYIPNHAIITSTVSQTVYNPATGRYEIIPAGSTYGAAVHTFDPDGVFKGKITFAAGYKGSDGMVASPSGAMMDSQGRLYIADGTMGYIERFNAAGIYDCRINISASTLYPKTPRMTSDGRLAAATSKGVVFFATSEYVSLKASASTLTFVKQTCAPDPTAKTITLANEGPGTLGWSASRDADWIALDGATSGTITGAGSQALSIKVDASGLAAGTHTGKVSIASNGGSADIAVTLDVYGAPTLTVSGGPYSFQAHGGMIPNAMPLNVKLSGDQTGTLSWSAQASDSWIAMVPASGPSNTGTVAGVGVSAAGLEGLANGSHLGNIKVSAGCADVPDVAISVSLSYFTGGTIEVSTNLDSAAFSATGPATYTGGGTKAVFSGVPGGTYTVTYGPVEGYKTPPASVVDVEAGRTASASGNYKDLRERNNIIVTMGGGKNEKVSVADNALILDAAGTELGSINIAGAGKHTGGSVTAAGDFDGDGIDEVVVARKGGEISGFAADGSALAGFSFSVFNPGIDVDLATGDIDGDGSDELIVASTTDAGDVEAVVHVLKYDPAAGVSFLASFKAFNEADKGANIAAGDIDGDGRAEVLVTEAGGGWRKVYIRMFALEGGEMVDAGGIDAGGSFTAADISSGDIDADGVDEIVITRRAAGSDKADRVTGYRAAGVQAFDFEGPLKGIKIAAGDVDFDGEAEVVVSEGTSNQSSTAIRIYTAGGALAGEFKAFKNANNIYGASVSLGRTAGQ